LYLSIPGEFNVFLVWKYYPDVLNSQNLLQIYIPPGSIDCLDGEFDALSGEFVEFEVHVDREAARLARSFTIPGVLASYQLVRQ